MLHICVCVATKAQDTLRQKTMAHIEEVLDTLNTHTVTMLAPGTSNPNGVHEQRYLKTFARPTKQIKGLVNMINTVADELDLY